MGVEPYLLASVLRGVMGQRLVGILCPACKAPRPATPDEPAFFTQAGLEVPADLQLYEAPGCDACEGMGFVGRVGIFEFLEMNEPIRELIRARASTQAVAQPAAGAGMRTMYVDGLLKCLAGDHHAGGGLQRDQRGMVGARPVPNFAYRALTAERRAGRRRARGRRRADRHRPAAG